MTFKIKVPFIYLIFTNIFFLTGYVVIGIREMSLYSFLMIINLPASLIVLPQVESFALSHGFILGSPPHVICTQAVAMTINALMIVMLIQTIVWARKINDYFKCGGNNG